MNKYDKGFFTMMIILPFSQPLAIAFGLGFLAYHHNPHPSSARGLIKEIL